MAHEVETMAYFGQRPWHELGVEVQQKLTATDMLPIAGMNWVVCPKPLLAQVNGTSEPIDSHVAIVRDIDKKVLGVLGKDYLPIQNTEIAKLADAICNNEPICETAISLKGGSRVSILMKVGDMRVKGDNSPIEKYLLLAGSHDGTLALTCMFTDIRVVCNNTLSLALKKAKDFVKIKHTANAHERMRQARLAMSASLKYWENFKILADKMAETAYTNQQMTELVDFLAPVPKKVQLEYAEHMQRWQPMEGENILDSIVGQTKAVEVPESMIPSRIQRTRQRIFELVDTGSGIDSIRGTAWGAYNVVSEYLDHHATYKETQGSSRSENRFESIMLGGNTARKKQQCFEKILEQVELKA